MPGIEYRKQLNEEQFTAVTAPPGPLLVLAAAGTGKTRTLVYRVAWLVEQGIPAERVLLLTFTNRAAREMLERTEALVGHGVGGLWGGTFHHMANRMLRKHAPLIGYNQDYTILDRDDSRAIIKECTAERRLDAEDFPKPEVLLSLYGNAANSEKDTGDLIAARFGPDPEVARGIANVLADYAKRKAAMSAMDFDDLLVNGMRLLRDHPEVCRQYQEQFLHVLVDEYQDTNVLQARIVDCLAEGHGNLLVVGDDFQSIYSWRGATCDNILSFPKRYPSAGICKLETNYRSSPEILEVANACIAGNPQQFQKHLRATRGSCNRPMLARLRDGEHQARFVLDHIARLERDGCRRQDIAVLYRAHYHAMELQMLLTRERIPYVITSGARFFEQAHIKDVCSIVRLLGNTSDEVAFSRLACMLPRVGQRTARKLWTDLGGSFDGRKADARAALRSRLPQPAVAGWDAIQPIFESYEREELDADPGEVIHRFVEAWYAKHAANVFDDAQRRVDDIRELVLYTARFESARDFLGEMALLSNLDAEAADTGAGGNNALRLSTVHQAKGLEWDAVIVIWMTEGMFPSARSMDESPENEAEERRLFYVAVTRAKDDLCLCVPEMRRLPDGGVMFCEPSRFVSELPPGLFRDVHVRRY